MSFRIFLLALPLMFAGCRETSTSDTGLKNEVIVRNNDELDSKFQNSFVRIEAGQFQMACVADPKERVGSDYPTCSVKITRPFEILATEVTQGQWEAVMGVNPSHFKTGADFPVEQVSWMDVAAFINKLNQLQKLDCGDQTTEQGLEMARRKSGCYRFPTSAEWEYAARAGTKSEFNLGENITTAQVNYNGEPFMGASKGESRESTVAVKSLPNKNNWGLYDMHGNVSEWVSDWFQWDYYKTVNKVTNPTGPKDGDYKLMRGGSWHRSAHYLTFSDHSSDIPNSRSNEVGFRLARTI